MEKPIEQKRILILIEDDTALRQVFTTYLEHQFQVLSAATGEEGLMLILTTDTVDLVITDFDLKGPMDGLDMMQAMQKKHLGTPIILCTGSILNPKSKLQETRLCEALLMPCLTLVHKPFKLAALNQVIETLLRNKERALP